MGLDPNKDIEQRRHACQLLKTPSRVIAMLGLTRVKTLLGDTRVKTVVVAMLGLTRVKTLLGFTRVKTCRRRRPRGVEPKAILAQEKEKA